LAAGYWLLAAGCWLQVAGSTFNALRAFKVKLTDFLVVYIG
jgi:hypothetical protein